MQVRATKRLSGLLHERRPRHGLDQGRRAPSCSANTPTKRSPAGAYGVRRSLESAALGTPPATGASKSLARPPKRAAAHLAPLGSGLTHQNWLRAVAASGVVLQPVVAVRFSNPMCPHELEKKGRFGDAYARPLGLTYARASSGGNRPNRARFPGKG